MSDDSARRPCRLCHDRDRPLVPIGCADGWDLCAPCYRRIQVRRYRRVEIDRHPNGTWAVDELAAAS
jgi:hypothetical protein